MIEHSEESRDFLSNYLAKPMYQPTYSSFFILFGVTFFVCAFKILSIEFYYLCMWMFGTYFADDIIQTLDVNPCCLELSADVGRVPLFTIEDWFQVELMSASLFG